jgi:hypothetical protein
MVYRSSVHFVDLLGVKCAQEKSCSLKLRNTERLRDPENNISMTLQSPQPRLVCLQSSISSLTLLENVFRIIRGFFLMWQVWDTFEVKEAFIRLEPSGCISFQQSPVQVLPPGGLQSSCLGH